MSAFDEIARELVELVDEQRPQAAAPLFPLRNPFWFGGGGNKWPGGLSANGALGGVNHALARRNARNAMNESMQARAMVNRFADTVADAGLRVEFEPKIEVLGITREYAAAWARDVEARFDLWAQDKRQHRAESINWYQSHPLYQLFQHRDNDIFVRFYYDPDPSLQNPLQFDFIDPDQIRGDALTTTGGFLSQDDGIKRDARGREIAYKVWLQEDEGKSYKEVEIPAKVGNRYLMLHGFKGEYAGQGRGYSRLAHAIQEFENITDFSASIIKKAINQSQIVGFVQPSKDEDAQPIFDGILTNQGAGPAAQMFGANPTPPNGASNVTAESLRSVTECYRIPEATMDTPGSLWINTLTKGSTIEFPKNTAPGDSFDKFVDAFSAHLSASLNIPLEVVLMKFGQNYSASRATLLLFWRVCQTWRDEMAADYLNPTVEMWLAGEIAAGRIIAPGWSDPRMRRAWLNCNWIGSAPPDIDPTKTATARRTNIETGVTNLAREAREFNGSSAEANIATNKALFKNFPLAPWVTTGGDQGAQPVEDDKDDE